MQWSLLWDLFQCIYGSQELNFAQYFGSYFCDPLGNKESLILITMIYLLCTNCPRYMGSTLALATTPTQIWRKTTSLPNESHLSHMSIIYLSYVNHKEDHVTGHDYHNMADFTATWSKCLTLRMRGAIACGPLSQRRHQGIHIHTQGSPSRLDHPHGDSRLQHQHRHKYHRCCHSGCLTHIQGQP